LLGNWNSSFYLRFPALCFFFSRLFCSIVPVSVSCVFRFPLVLLPVLPTFVFVCSSVLSCSFSFFSFVLCFFFFFLFAQVRLLSSSSLTLLLRLCICFFCALFFSCFDLWRLFFLFFFLFRSALPLCYSFFTPSSFVFSEAFLWLL